MEIYNFSQLCRKASCKDYLIYRKFDTVVLRKRKDIDNKFKATDNREFQITQKTKIVRRMETCALLYAVIFLIKSIKLNELESIVKLFEVF